MRAWILSICLSCFSLSLSAQELSAEQAVHQIQGLWQLLTYVDRDGNQSDYSKQFRVWRFDGDKLSLDSDDLGHLVADHFRLKRSIFRVDTPIILLSDKLKQTHLTYGKLVLESVDNQTLIFTDWDKQVSYRLRRVQPIVSRL
ncbi:hypothetical protein [Ferrimonas aestuarii]|uniref:TIGR03067 domain-containing protein n=1 Tax=Ferrimonas aestuarii TaxID=2569539 RepID=A0A4U1BT16_9GAMM|nr:hypothetical protein [Ferrimonas aestuarii]TKB56680.1 hypothetical protein FCL42_05980 [Ferrimonas aestuarii]